VSHNPSRGCMNQKQQMPLEMGGARACVEMDLTNGRKLSFE
jgi:hypothetical protein